MKICNNCNVQKDLSLFSKRSVNKDGFNNTCKECVKTKTSDYFKEYYKCNKDEISKYKKEHYNNNIEKYLKKAKKQRSENKDDYLEYLKKWREENKEYSKNYLKEWFSNNPNKRKEYWQNLRNSSPHVVAWRRILYNTIQRIGTRKSSSTLNELGYSPDELKSHIEKLFTEGMNWDNWGEWHIDHIFPISKFDKKTPMCVVNSLENLQPLWALENLRKSNK